MTLPDKLFFTVEFPTREGFLSRQCNDGGCKRVFKVHQEDIRGDMHCPYCGIAFPNDQLWTNEQAQFARESAIHQARPILAAEVQKMIRAAFKGPAWTFTPGPREPPVPAPAPPAELPTDSELKCPECSVRFQVEGIFGYCPGCRAENLRLYDANLAIIRREVVEGEHPTRALRHAYVDLVSTFEIFCRKEADARGLGTGRFQNLPATQKFFADALGVDIQASLSPDEFLAVRRAFQKRHVLEHRDGVIDQRYVDEVPEDIALLGQKASLALDELQLGATGVRRMLAVVVGTR